MDRLRSAYRARELAGLSVEEVFTRAYRRGRWGGARAASGRGSDLDQTRALRDTLRDRLDELGVRTLLDIPCGDFHWMRHVDLSGIRYTGGDIVEDLVRRNRARFGAESVRFRVIDLIGDALPRADLVLCRDALVHFSFSHALRALANLRRSGSTWLLATTFPAREENVDIVTGDWRALNLTAAPFHLPAPLRLLEEGCTQDGGAYADKSLGLWRLETLPADLERRAARLARSA